MVYVQDINGKALMPTQRHGKVRRLLRDGLGVVGHIRYVTYVTEVPDVNSWGLYFATTTDIPPFDWATYVCFGSFQIAITTVNQPRLAARWYIVNQWEEWAILI